MLTAMSFLKQRYTAKAVHEQEAQRIANTALCRRCKFTCKCSLIVSIQFGESQTPRKSKAFSRWLGQRRSRGRQHNEKLRCLLFLFVKEETVVVQ